MQLICFYASGGGLKDPNPTHPLIKKASTHPRFGATVPPPPQTPPLKNAHCILSRKNTRRQAAPLWKPPFLPLAIVFVASWPSFELRQLQRLQRGRGVGRGGGYVLNELQSLCSACVSFSVIVYCILYIVYFSFLHKQDEEEAPNRYQKIEQINNRRCENKIQYLQRFFAGLLQLKFQAGISQLLARGHQASEKWIKYAEFYVIRKGKEESSPKGKVKAGEKVKRIWRIRRKVVARSQV